MSQIRISCFRTSQMICRSRLYAASNESDVDRLTAERVRSGRREARITFRAGRRAPGATSFPTSNRYQNTPIEREFTCEFFPLIRRRRTDESMRI